MPKWGNRVPKPHFHKASGQARLKVDGREIWLGKWDSAEARRKYREFLAQRAEDKAAGPTMGPERTVTVSVAIFRFWQWAEGRYRDPDGRPTREAGNLRDALRPLRTLFGDLPLAEFGPSKLYALQGAMARSGLARTTVNARVGKVRRFVRWAVGHELAPASLVTALEAVEPLKAGQGTRESPGRRPVAWPIVAAALPYLPELHRALVLVLWHTGARVGEVATLTTRMIDRSEADVWKATLDRHKTAHRGQGRVILFGPEAIEAIRGWLRPSEPDEPIFSPLRVDARQAKRGGPRPPGRQFSRPSLAQTLRRATARGGVEPWTLAQLRHSRATILRERFGLDVAAIILGHSRPTMTAHYSRTAVSHAVDAVRTAG